MLFVILLQSKRFQSHVCTVFQYQSHCLHRVSISISLSAQCFNLNLIVCTEFEFQSYCLLCVSISISFSSQCFNLNLIVCTQFHSQSDCTVFQSQSLVCTVLQSQSHVCTVFQSQSHCLHRVSISISLSAQGFSLNLIVCRGFQYQSLVCRVFQSQSHRLHSVSISISLSAQCTVQLLLLYCAVVAADRADTSNKLVPLLLPPLAVTAAPSCYPISVRPPSVTALCRRCPDSRTSRHTRGNRFVNCQHRGT